MIAGGSIEGCGDVEESDRVPSSRDRAVCRRTILRAGPTVVAAGVLAGCLGDDDDSNDDHTTSSTEGTDDDENGNGEIETEYELELSINDEIDLTDVYDRLLEEFTPTELAEFTENDWKNAWQTVHDENGLREQDYLEGEYTVKENRCRTEKSSKRRSYS